MISSQARYDHFDTAPLHHPVNKRRTIRLYTKNVHLCSGFYEIFKISLYNPFRNGNNRNVYKKCIFFNKNFISFCSKKI